MQYKEATHYEINKAVAKHLKVNTIAYDRTGIVLFDGMDATPFDPCNNPADAMPIVIENGISLIFDTWRKAWVAGIAYWVDGCEWQISYEVERMNQYRAAMELFLMMKDAENEK